MSNDEKKGVSDIHVLFGMWTAKHPSVCCTCMCVSTTIQK